MVDVASPFFFKILEYIISRNCKNERQFTYKHRLSSLINQNCLIGLALRSHERLSGERDSRRVSREAIN